MDKKVPVPVTTPTPENLSERLHYRPQRPEGSFMPMLPRRQDGNSPTSISYSNRDLPRFHDYRNGNYFDRTFAHQGALVRRERLMRFFLSAIVSVLFIMFITYVWYPFPEPKHNEPQIPVYVSQVPDQMILYRILGNDLPPRHKTGQTLSNVRFILDHEQKFPNTQKWWILNRIVDSAYEAALIELLKEYKQEYIRIPFEVDEYLKRDFRLEDFPEPDFFHSEEYMRFSKVAKLRTIDYTYHDKNLYAMNNNGGRNYALAHGKAIPGARWILPFDGNCYLTPKAFTEIRSQLDSWGDKYKYFIVPMARLINNTNLLVGPDTRPLTPEEPQIIFRNDAEETYHENMRYGRRSKLELLWRLGVTIPSKIFNKPPVPWEADDIRAITAPEQQLYRSIGWVFRLFSGQVRQEENKKEASSLRAFNRLLAIQDFLDGLDETITRTTQKFDPNRLFLYNERELNQLRLRYWAGDAMIAKVIGLLISQADKMVDAAMNLFHEGSARVDPSTRTSFLRLKTPSDQDNAKPDESRQAQGRDADSREFQLVRQNDNESASDDNLTETDVPLPPVSPSELFENVTTMTLAYYYSNHEPYARWAANLIRTFLLSSHAVGVANDLEVTVYPTDTDAFHDVGYNFPTLSKVPRTIPTFPYEEPPILDDIFGHDPSFFLDAVRLLYEGHKLTHREYTELRSIASEWLEQLISSPEGVEHSRLADHRGTLYDLQVTALANFVDDVRLYLRIVNRCRMRIGKQFVVSNDVRADDLTQSQEIEYVKDQTEQDLISTDEYDQAIFQYTTLNLQYWMLLTRGIQNTGAGADLWQHTSRDDQRLSRAMMGHLSQYSSRLDDDILKPLLHIAETAHRASDERRGIWHEHGDEHDYFQHFLKSTGGKMNVFQHDRSGDAESEPEASTRVGLGKEARRQGIPPFWMLGIA